MNIGYNLIKGKKKIQVVIVSTQLSFFYSGYVVPSHGVIHVGYDNKESVKEDYEVLCEDQPCSLRYLASKKIRDQIFERERFLNSRYSTKIVNMLLAVEKVFASIIRKVEFHLLKSKKRQIGVLTRVSLSRQVLESWYLKQVKSWFPKSLFVHAQGQ